MQAQIEHTTDMEHLNRLRRRKVLRCAIYIRVSTAEQRISGWSLQAQEAGLRKLAESKGWKVVGVYADEGKSARKRLKGRKEIHRLMEDVKAGLVDCIVFKELDRWMRNMSDFYKLQDILDEHGVEWVSQEQPNLEMRTKEGRLQVNMLLSFGQNETDTTSDRIKYTNKYLVQQKRWLTGAQNLPKGHLKDEENHVHIDPAVEPYVRALIDGVLRYGSVNKSLVEANELFPDIKPMRYQNALDFLRNPILRGEYRGVPDFVEKPYLTQEEWDRLQRNIRQNSKDTKRHFYIFSKLVRCQCGRVMAGAYAVNRSKKICYGYRCNVAIQRTGVCTSRSRFGEERMERELLALVKQEVDGMIAKVESIQHSQAKKPKKKNNRASIEKQLEKLEDVYIDSPTMTKEKYEQRKAAILAKLVEDEPEEKLPELADLEKVKALFEGNIEEVYYTLTKEERREFWRGILQEIRVNNGQIVGIDFIH